MRIKQNGLAWSTYGVALLSAFWILNAAGQGAAKLIYRFNSTNGISPYNGVCVGPDGNYYGATTAGGIANLGTVFRYSLNGTLTSLVSFTNG